MHRLPLIFGYGNMDEGCGKLRPFRRAVFQAG